MVQTNISHSEFSNYLFWDVDRTKIDFDKRKAWVIDRVLSHGMFDTPIEALRCYTYALSNPEKTDGPGR